jgi:hypothetical protein
MGRQRLSYGNLVRISEKTFELSFFRHVDGHRFRIVSKKRVVKFNSEKEEPRKGRAEFLVKSASYVTWLQFLFSVIPFLSRVGSQLKVLN